MEPGPHGGDGRDRGLLLHLARAEDEEIADRAVQFYEKMVEATPGFPFLPGLYSGISGVGWTVEHLSGRLFSPEEEEDEDDSNQALDETLLESLGKPWTGDYDLVLGLVGRVSTPWSACRAPALWSASTAPRQLEVWGRRGRRARPDDPSGAASRASARAISLRIPQPGRGPRRPGSYALLGRICEIPALRDRAKSPLAGAVSWVLAQAYPPESPSRFATFAEDVSPCRLAWCYGDAGIAATRVGAARRTGNLDWEKEALRIALAFARSETLGDGCGVGDAGLCHGTAGAFTSSTGSIRLRRGRAGAGGPLLVERMFEQRRPDGLGGFLAYTPHHGRGGVGPQPQLPDRHCRHRLGLPPPRAPPCRRTRTASCWIFE